MSTTVVSSLVTALETLTLNNTGFTKIPMVYDIQGNAKMLTKNRFGVVPGAISEIDSVTRFYTIEQSFTIHLTNGYIKLKNDDKGKLDAATALLNKVHDLYKTIVKLKGGLPNIVMNIRGLSVDEPIFFEEEDTVQVSLSFGVIYRIGL